MPIKAEPLFYDARVGNYWIRNGQEFIRLDTGHARLHLRAGGCDPDKYDHGLNEVERGLVNAQKDRLVHYSGPIAGFPVGPLVLQDARRVLVTSQAQPVKPVKGDSDALDSFIAELLPGEQAQHFCLWLAAGLRAQACVSFAPGQMVGLAGPAGCGKSLLQAVVAAAFGGRSACPYQYLTGETKFNQHLAEAEVWTIQDCASSTDIRTRRKFGASLKEAIVNREIAVYPKGGKAVMLPTFRRVTASFNDEPENVMLMPPMDESLLDKVNLYHCGHSEVGDDRAKTWSTFTAELPAFLHQCLALKVPAKWRDNRYGVKSFQHPLLLEILSSAAQESRLLNIVDETLFTSKDGAPWVGSATQLERQLSATDMAPIVAKLCYYSTACAVYLSRLAAKQPERVTKQVKDGKPVWTISAPK